MLCFDR